MPISKVRQSRTPRKSRNEEGQSRKDVPWLRSQAVGSPAPLEAGPSRARCGTGPPCPWAGLWVSHTGCARAAPQRTASPRAVRWLLLPRVGQTVALPRRKAKPGASSPRKAEFRRRGARRGAPLRARTQTRCSNPGENGRCSPRERPLLRAARGGGQPRRGPWSPPAAAAASAAPSAALRRGWTGSSRRGVLRLFKPPRRRDRPRNFPLSAVGSGDPARRPPPRAAPHTREEQEQNKSPSEPASLCLPARFPATPLRAERSPQRPGGVRSALPTGGAPPAAGASPAGRRRKEGAPHPPSLPRHLSPSSGTASLPAPGLAGDGREPSPGARRRPVHAAAGRGAPCRRRPPLRSAHWPARR